MTSQSNQQRMGREVMTSVIAAAITSVMGGSIGTYVAFRVLETRVQSMETAIERLANRNAEQDNQQALLQAQISGIAVDVSFIRGRLDK